MAKQVYTANYITRYADALPGLCKELAQLEPVNCLDFDLTDTLCNMLAELRGNTGHTPARKADSHFQWSDRM